MSNQNVLDNGKNDGERQRKTCLFCLVADEASKDLTKLVHKDEELVAFPDIRPAAEVHILVVTRCHIPDAKSLRHCHLPLLDRMIALGQELIESSLKEKNLGALSTDDMLFGFHWPPFHSVAHLHMHAIAPKTSMRFLSRVIFRPNSWWFVTPQYVRQRLLSQNGASNSQGDVLSNAGEACESPALPT